MGRVQITPIEWQGEESHLFLNPRWSSHDRHLWQSEFKKHALGRSWIGVATSGTGNTPTKIVLLTRESLLVSAQAVVAHLGVSEQDTWFHTLPDFHVGGLGIWARSQVSGCQVVQPLNWSWEGKRFVNELTECQGSWTSLVPTQLFDLVNEELLVPPCLKGVLVGGGSFSEGLFQKARKLGWPVIPTYGMSECASQVATATMKSLANPNSIPGLKVLDHIQTRLGESGRLEIKSPALFSGYLSRATNGTGTEFIDPKCDGWFATSDQVKLIDGIWLEPVGRVDDQIKVLGELVSLGKVQAVVDHFCWEQKLGEVGVVVATPDERRGNHLVLVCEASQVDDQLAQKILSQVNQQVLPFEKIQCFEFVSQLPRTELGKVRRGRVLEMIGDHSSK